MALVDGTLTVEGALARPGWSTSALVLVPRGSSDEVRVENTAPGGATPRQEFAFGVDLAHLAEHSATVDDTFDPWLEIARPRRSLTPGRSDYSFDDVFETKLVRLGNFAETHRPIGVLELPGGRGLVEITEAGNVSIKVGDQPLARPRVVTEVLDATSDGARVCLAISTSSRPVSTAEVLVVGRQSNTVVAFAGTVTSATIGARGWFDQRVDAEIDLSDTLAGLADDEDTIDLVVRINGGAPDERTVRIPAVRGVRARNLRSLTHDVDGRTTAFVPYMTFRGRNLSYRIERYKSADYRYMMRLARVAWLFTVTRPFTRIWLVGEVPYKAQDNGWHLFRYLRTTHPRRRAYYVIEPTSPDRARLEPYGNVVDRFSRDHIRYTFMASRFVGSHHAEYLLASRDLRIVRRARGVRVFLQHGPTATKNVVPNYGRQSSVEQPTERFIVTSELEKKIVVEDYGYRPHQVSVTGFARFDTLLAGDVEKERTVLVMPTWRDDLMSEEAFLGSEYFRNWRSFLQSPDLHDLLERADLTVRLIPHPNMRKYADHFASDRVVVVKQGDDDVQRLIKSGSVLITDFSSVAWDFSYLRRPVLYFQFDRSQLVGARSPHIDFDESLPGSISATPDQLVAHLTEVVAAGLEMSDVDYARARAFLTYSDQNNCARIESAVARSWNLRVALERVRNAEISQRGWRYFRSGPLYFRSMRALNAVARLLPRTNAVLFECDRGTHFSDSPRYLYERLVAREHGLTIYWAMNTTERFADENTHKIRRHSVRYWWVASRARYWVNNQNFPSDLRPGRRTQFLETWHGTPLKRMQHDVENMVGRDADYDARAARLTGYWSTLLSPSPYATRAFRSAFRYTGPVLEVGYPRNDVLSWPDRDDRAARARARLGLTGDSRRVVLYAPTFRDDARSGVHWKHQLALDIAGLERALGDDMVLLVRFHPLVRNPLPPEYKDSTFVRDVASYPDIQELLLISDVLVTDYSSLFFDFAALERPTIFFAYDLDKYRDDLRGFYLEYEAEIPGPVVRTNDELVAALSEVNTAWAPYRARSADFRRTYGPADDGGASDRVLDAFFGRAIGAAPTDLSVAATAGWSHELGGNPLSVAS